MINQLPLPIQVLPIASRGPERFPKRTAGVSWSNLNAYGYGNSTDFQKSVLNVITNLPGYIRNVFGRSGQRIDVLRNFEGFVFAFDSHILFYH